ncbi:MAG: hypothetical protein D6806_14470 [Deltaproteobacteria bacterium]|nr:MAG: hypothetical protein D6806_14470 [Deltaproteobacteria bacterium]
MSFDSLLKRVCDDVAGCVSVALMDQEGLVIAKHDAQEPAFDIEAVCVEAAGAFPAALRAASSAQDARVEELVIFLDNGTLLFRMLKEGRFVAAWLSPDAVIGRARFVLRTIRLDLEKELTG